MLLTGRYLRPPLFDSVETVSTPNEPIHNPHLRHEIPARAPVSVSLTFAIVSVAMIVTYGASGSSLGNRVDSPVTASVKKYWRWVLAHGGFEAGGPLASVTVINTTRLKATDMLNRHGRNPRTTIECHGKVHQSPGGIPASTTRTAPDSVPRALFTE